MINFVPTNNQFLRLWRVLPYVELKDITVKESRNVNFIMFNVDTVNISNIYLQDLSVKDVNVTYSMFHLSLGHAMNVYKLTANNVTGPVLYLSNVLAQNFSTLSLNDMKTSQGQLRTSLQSIIVISKVDDLSQKGLDIRKSQDTFLNNINLNGYTSIEGMDYTKTANNSYLLSVDTIYGK